jgi:hypothetical protein
MGTLGKNVSYSKTDFSVIPYGYLNPYSYLVFHEKATLLRLFESSRQSRVRAQLFYVPCGPPLRNSEQLPG